MPRWGAVMLNEDMYQAMLDESRKIGVVRPRLHLFRPPGFLRGGNQDAGDLPA